MVVTTERVVQSPPREVFKFVATNHFANHPRWDPSLVEMTPAEPGPIGVGSTARIVRRQGGRRVDGTAKVIAYEPDRFAAFDVRSGPVELHQRVEFISERQGGATRLRLTIDAQADGMLSMLLPLMRGQFRKTMQRSLATIEALLAAHDGSAGTGESGQHADS